MKKVVVLLLLCCLLCPALASGSATYPIEGNPTVSIMWTSFSDRTAADWAFTQAWSEATGINIESIGPADNTALLLHLASGDYPDVLVYNYGAYTGGLNKQIEDGLAINLLDYAEYAPDYFSLINSFDPYVKALTYNEGVYSFGYLWDVNTPYNTWRGMVVRGDWLESLEMDVPRTNDAFYDMLVAFRDEMGAEIPLCANWWIYMLPDGFFTSEYGIPSSEGYEIDGVFHYGAYEPGYKDALAYLHKLYSEGLFDVNFQTTDEGTSQASLLNGKTGAHYTSAGRINTLLESKVDEGFVLKGIGSLGTSSGERAMFSQADPYVSPNFHAYITEDCRDVQAAMKLLNYLYTEDGILLSNYGVEGVSYEMVDGVPRFTDLILNNPEGLSINDALIDYALTAGPYVCMKGQSEQRFTLDAQKTAIEAWADSDQVKYRLQSNTILPEHQEEYTSLWTDIETYITEMRNRFISGAESLDQYDAYLAQLESMGIGRVIEIKQAALDAYNGK